MSRAALLVAGRDARQSARLLVLSVIGLVLLAYLMAWGFPDFRERMTAMGKHAPRFMRKIIDARSGGFSFEAYVALGFYHPVSLALMTSWPIVRAVRAVAGDLDRGALGWMLAYPIGRLPFLWARAAVIFAGIAVLQASVILGLRGWGAYWQVGLGPWGPYLAAGVGGFLIYGAVASLVLWISAMSTKPALPAMAGAGIVFVSLLLEAVSGPFNPFERWRWLSLFHYYDAPALFKGAPLATADVAVLLAVIALGLVGASVSFARRDLPI